MLLAIKNIIAHLHFSAKITDVHWKVVDQKYEIHMDGSINNGVKNTWQVKAGRCVFVFILVIQ